MQALHESSLQLSAHSTRQPMTQPVLHASAPTSFPRPFLADVSEQSQVVKFTRGVFRRGQRQYGKRSSRTGQEYSRLQGLLGTARELQVREAEQER